MEEKLLNSFNTYFNNILKAFLKYIDIFIINVDLDKRTVYLKVVNSNSQLSNFLNNSPAVLEKIRSEILFSFQKDNPDVSYINISLYENGLSVSWGYSLESLQDIGPVLTIAKTLDSDSLSNLCKINPQFINMCNNDFLWISLFKNKFGDIPDYIKENKDYKRTYLDILKFLEIKEQYDNINKIYKGKESSTIRVTFYNIITNLSLNALIYVLQNKLLFINKDYVDMLSDNKNLINIRVLEELLSKYKFSKLSTKIRNDIYYKVLREVLINNSYPHIDILELLLDYKTDNKYIIDTLDVSESLRRLKGSESPINEFDYDILNQVTKLMRKRIPRFSILDIL